MARICPFFTSTIHIPGATLPPRVFLPFLKPSSDLDRDRQTLPTLNVYRSCIHQEENITAPPRFFCPSPPHLSHGLCRRTIPSSTHCRESLVVILPKSPQRICLIHLAHSAASASNYPISPATGFRPPDQTACIFFREEPSSNQLRFESRKFLGVQGPLALNGHQNIPTRLFQPINPNP